MNICALPIDVGADRVFLAAECSCVHVHGAAAGARHPLHGTFHETMMRRDRRLPRDGCERPGRRRCVAAGPYWPPESEHFLCDMGFDAERVVRALVLGRGDVQFAVHYLATNQV